MQTQTFNIALPKELVKKMDKVSKQEYRNRSELIREAVLAYLRNAERLEELFAYGRKVGRKMGIKTEEDVVKIVNEYRRNKKST